MTHGIYAQGLHPEERELYADTLANRSLELDEDIAMRRVRLMRLYRAQAEWEAQHGISLSSQNDGLPVVEQEDEVGSRPGPDGRSQGYANRRVIRRRTDFGPEIRAETRLLAELIRTKAIIESSTHGEESRDELAEQLRTAGDAATEDLNGNGKHGDADGDAKSSEVE